MERTEQQPKPSSAYTSEFLLSDEEIRQRGIPEQDFELYRRAQYQAAYGIDTWLPALPAHTFRSEFIELTHAEGLELARWTDERARADLQALTERIDHVIKTKFPNGAFVKLNTRSPKDVPQYDFDCPRVQQAVAHEFDSLGAKLGNDDNEEVWAFIRATIKMTRVNSGAEAVDLLQRSKRIREDLGKILRFSERHFSARVTVREWLPELAERPQFEFRGFVHKKQLNAVTQYFHPNYSPELHARQDEIAAKIKEFHDSIRDKIPHQSYVIDFYLTRDDHLLIVELNPFHIGAGAGLFTWREHRELFMNGPYTFRCVTSVSDEVTGLVPLRWAKWIDQKYHPHKWIQPPAPEDASDDESDESEEKGGWCVVL